MSRRDAATIRSEMDDLHPRWLRTALASRRAGDLLPRPKTESSWRFRSPSGAGPFGVPRALFQTEVHTGVHTLRTHYVPSNDGTRFLVHTRSGDLVPVPITVVLNWTAALKK